MSTWFRMYNEVLDDPKVQMLDPVTFKLWVNLMCAACRFDGPLPPVKELAFVLRITEDETRGLLSELGKAGLIDAVGESLFMHNWSERQYKSDSSTDRMRHKRARDGNVTSHVTSQDRHTDRHKAVTHAVTVTRSDTETDTDTENTNTQKRAPVSTTQLVSNSERFKQFWQNYPKKVGYDEAFTAWFDVRPPIDENLFVTIMAKLRIFRGCRQWIEKDGQYIPRASDFIRDRRWEEEVKPAKHPKAGYNPTGVVL